MTCKRGDGASDGGDIGARSTKDFKVKVANMTSPVDYKLIENQFLGK